MGSTNKKRECSFLGDDYDDEEQARRCAHLLLYGTNSFYGSIVMEPHAHRRPGGFCMKLGTVKGGGLSIGRFLKRSGRLYVEFLHPQ